MFNIVFHFGITKSCLYLFTISDFVLAKRYCLMLHEEGGYVILNQLINHESVNPEIRRICQLILDGQTDDIIHWCKCIQNYFKSI